MLFTDCLLSTSHICGQQARVEGSPKGVISALLSGNPSPPATVSGLFCVVKGSRETGVPERGGAPTLGSWIRCPGKADAMHKAYSTENSTQTAAEKSHVPQLLSLCCRAWEQQLLKPECPRTHAPKQEKPLKGEAHALQLENSPHSPQLEKISHSNKDPAQ